MSQKERLMKHLNEHPEDLDQLVGFLINQLDGKQIREIIKRFNKDVYPNTNVKPIRALYDWNKEWCKHLAPNLTFSNWENEPPFCNRCQIYVEDL